MKLLTVLFLAQLIVSASVLAVSGELYPIQESWQPTNTGAENISLLVFRDRNADGGYSVNDPPVANVAVIVHRPDGSCLIRRSNLYGFVNFTNSATISAVDIAEEATYSFEVVPPPGWRVTTENRLQTASFRKAPRTRPGIVADRVPSPVGLAPVPKVSGQFQKWPEDGGSRFMVDARLMFSLVDSSEFEEVATDEHGRFSAEPGRGVWRIYAVSDTGQPEFLRTIRVDDAPVRLSALVQGKKLIPRLANLSTIDFDGITHLPITKMPDYPAGLRWTDLIVTRNTTYLGAGYINNTVAGAYVGYNSSGYPVTVESDKPFDFAGAYFGVAWSDAEGETLTVKAWRGTELVYQEALMLSAMGPVWFDADFRSVTRVEFATQHYWQFVMDKPVFRLAE